MRNSFWNSIRNFCPKQDQNICGSIRSECSSCRVWMIKKSISQEHPLVTIGYVPLFPVQFARRLFTTCTNLLSISTSHSSLQHSFFFLNFVGHMSIFGATDTPVSDFWWRLLWVSKPEWVLPYLNFAEAYLIYVTWDSPLVRHLCWCI